MSPLLIPEDGVSETFLFKKESKDKRKFENRQGECITLRVYKTKKPSKRKPKKTLKYQDGKKAILYQSKKIGKGYMYGCVLGKKDLLVINERKKKLVVTTFKNGWLYFDVLFFSILNNKRNK
jgi:hypothetical protein